MRNKQKCDSDCGNAEQSVVAGQGNKKSLNYGFASLGSLAPLFPSPSSHKINQQCTHFFLNHSRFIYSLSGSLPLSLQTQLPQPFTFKSDSVPKKRRECVEKYNFITLLKLERPFFWPWPGGGSTATTRCKPSPRGTKKRDPLSY